jgi:uncharacterized protein (TIGR04255 family)
MNKLPKKITPCPIVEAIVQIRFSSMLPSEAVFGVVYSKVGSDFDKVNNLPILQIPEIVRAKDPNLTYQAHYSLIKENFPVQLNIGPRTITFSNTNKYIGWGSYYSFIEETLDKINDTNVIHLPERIGVRYINFFDTQILDRVNLNLSIQDHEVKSESTHIRTELFDDDYQLVIQIVNNQNVTIQGKNNFGSLIDIDCSYNYEESNSSLKDSFLNVIDKAHDKEKENFFGLLLEEFLSDLNPVY